LKRLSILLVALLALILAACSSEGTGASADASEPAATEASTPEPTEEPTETPEASASAAAFPSFDMNGDPELAARFPDTVGGVPMQTFSLRADQFMTGQVDPSFQAFLDATGADLEDVSVAVGGSTDPENPLRITAFRVLGVAEDRLEQEFLAASEEQGDLSGAEQTSLAGKDVWTATDPSGETGTTVYIYVKDDTVYFLTGTEEQATEILAALP
jgi:hypothetical protein